MSRVRWVSGRGVRVRGAAARAAAATLVALTLSGWMFPAPAAAGRWFLYKELVLSGFYSPEGQIGVPMGDWTEDNFELSPRPPGNYAGVEFIRTFDGGGRLAVDAVNLHPRILFDRMKSEERDLDRLTFAPQDFWVRFRPGGSDRWTLRAGQFVIPYGVNPVLAPRQRFILPLEALDLGLKWDWGVGIKGPAGEYDWELAATIGSGEALHDTHLFSRSDSSSVLLTGRVGTPTYWDFQYGLSFLVGDLPMIRAATKMSPFAVSRWRVGLDAFWRQGTYLMAGAQLTYGQDGFADDAWFRMELEAADVLGLRAMADWVVPWKLDLRLAAQFESIQRKLGEDLDDTAFVFEAAYSATTSVTLAVDYRMELDRSMPMADNADAIYLTLAYYSR